MSLTDPIRVLLVDDDSDDYLLLRESLDEAEREYRLTFVSTYTAGLHALAEGVYDIAFLDWRIGPESGLDLVRAAREKGCTMPVILVSGIDLGALVSESDRQAFVR